MQPEQQSNNTQQYSSKQGQHQKIAQSQIFSKESDWTNNQAQNQKVQQSQEVHNLQHVHGLNRRMPNQASKELLAHQTNYKQPQFNNFVNNAFENQSEVQRVSEPVPSQPELQSQQAYPQSIGMFRNENNPHQMPTSATNSKYSSSQSTKYTIIRNQEHHFQTANQNIQENRSSITAGASANSSFQPSSTSNSQTCHGTAPGSGQGKSIQVQQQQQVQNSQVSPVVEYFNASEQRVRNATSSKGAGARFAISKGHSAKQQHQGASLLTKQETILSAGHQLYDGRMDTISSIQFQQAAQSQKSQKSQGSSIGSTNRVHVYGANHGTSSARPVRNSQGKQTSSREPKAQASKTEGTNTSATNSQQQSILHHKNKYFNSQDEKYVVFRGPATNPNGATYNMSNQISIQPSSVSNAPSSGNRSQRPINQKLAQSESATGSRFKYRAIKAQQNVFEVASYDQEQQHITLGAQESGTIVSINQPRVIQGNQTSARNINKQVKSHGSKSQTQPSSQKEHVGTSSQNVLQDRFNNNLKVGHSQIAAKNTQITLKQIQSSTGLTLQQQSQQQSARPQTVSHPQLNLAANQPSNLQNVVMVHGSSNNNNNNLRDQNELYDSKNSSKFQKKSDNIKFNQQFYKIPEKSSSQKKSERAGEKIITVSNHTSKGKKKPIQTNKATRDQPQARIITNQKDKYHEETVSIPPSHRKANEPLSAQFQNLNTIHGGHQNAAPVQSQQKRIKKHAFVPQNKESNLPAYNENNFQKRMLTTDQSQPILNKELQQVNNEMFIVNEHSATSAGESGENSLQANTHQTANAREKYNKPTIQIDNQSKPVKILSKMPSSSQSYRLLPQNNNQLIKSPKRSSRGDHERVPQDTQQQMIGKHVGQQPMDTRDVSGTSIVGQSSSSTTTNKKNLVAVFSSNAANSIVLSDQPPMMFDASSNYRQEDQKMQKMTSQISTSSKSPNTKQFQQHQQQLSHLFDALKQRHFEQNGAQEHQTTIIQEQLVPALNDLVTFKNNCLGQRNAGVLGQRGTRNGANFGEGTAQELQGHGHTMDSVQDPVQKTTNQKHSLVEAKYRRANLSKYESQSQFSQVNLVIKNKEEKVSRKIKEIEEVAVQPVSTTSQSSLLVMQPGFLQGRSQQVTYRGQDVCLMINNPSGSKEIVNDRHALPKYKIQPADRGHMRQSSNPTQPLTIHQKKISMKQASAEIDQTVMKGSVKGVGGVIKFSHNKNRASGASSNGSHSMKVANRIPTSKQQFFDESKPRQAILIKQQPQSFEMSRQSQRQAMRRYRSKGSMHLDADGQEINRKEPPSNIAAQKSQRSSLYQMSQSHDILPPPEEVLVNQQKGENYRDEIVVTQKQIDNQNIIIAPNSSKNIEPEIGSKPLLKNPMKKFTTHREVTSVDYKTGHKIENAEIDCHPLAVSLKISSSTKIKQQRGVHIKGQGLNTQASREHIPTSDLFEKGVDEGKKHWQSKAENLFKKNNFMIADKTGDDDESSSVVQASTQDEHRLQLENQQTLKGHKYFTTLQGATMAYQGNLSSQQLLMSNQVIERSNQSDNLEDSHRDIPQTYGALENSQNKNQLTQAQLIKKQQKPMHNIKANQKFNINLEKIKTQHSRKISEASAGLSRGNDKAKSNVDFRIQRTALDHQSSAAHGTGGQQERRGQQSNHQSQAILSRQNQHLVKISDSGQDLSKGGYQPAFTPIFRDYDIHSSKSSENESKKHFGKAILQLEDQQYQKALLRPQSTKLSRQAQPKSIPEQFTNMDIFETMEKEMKQIMNLFAKERKSRKKEMSHLQAQISEKDAIIEQMKRTYEEDKLQLIQKWQDEVKLREYYQSSQHNKTPQTDNKHAWTQSNQELNRQYPNSNLLSFSNDQVAQSNDKQHFSDQREVQEQHEATELFQKQVKVFKSQLDTKQSIIDESNQQIMDQAAQIECMQDVISQLQNERRDQRIQIDNMAAQNNIIRQEMASSQVTLGHQQQAEMTQRSQSLQKQANKLTTSLIPNIEISRFQLEKQQVQPNSTIATPMNPLNKIPEMGTGMFVMQDSKYKIESSGSGFISQAPSQQVQSNNNQMQRSATFDAKDRHYYQIDSSSSSIPFSAAQDMNKISNLSNDKRPNELQFHSQNISHLNYQLAQGERLQYEGQISNLMAQINQLQAEIRMQENEKRNVRHRAPSSGDPEPFKMNSSIYSSPVHKRFQHELPMQQQRDQPRGSSPPLTRTDIIRPLRLQAQNSPQRPQNMSEKIQARVQNSRSARSLKDLDQQNLATVSEEGDHSRSSNQAGAIKQNQSPANIRPHMIGEGLEMAQISNTFSAINPQERQQERPNINPLKLDQLISHANTFGQNLENMESRLRQIDQMQLQNALMNSYSYSNSFQAYPSQRDTSHGGQGSYTHRVMDYNHNSQSQITQSQPQMSGSSLLHGVQGGNDTQSLETIIEFKDQDLIGGLGVFATGLRSSRGAGTDTGTSRLDNRDLRYYNNSSSLSNFVLPQTTYRTNKTNRSFKSGNGYGLMGAFGHNGRGGTLGGVSGVLTVNNGHSGGHSGGHVGSISAIPQLNNMTQNGAGQNSLQHNQLSAQRQQHNMSQLQPSIRSRDINQSAGVQKTSSGSGNNQNSSSGGGQNNQQLSINIRQSQPLQTDQLATYRSHAVGSGLGLQQPIMTSGGSGIPGQGQADHQAISMIFEEVQQNKRQLTQIMDFITRLKQQTDEENQANTNGIATGSGPRQQEATNSPSNDNDILEQISAAQGQSSGLDNNPQESVQRDESGIHEMQGM